MTPPSWQPCWATFRARRNLSELARETGIARETLYKVTRGEGNPTLATVGKLARALGLWLSLTPLGGAARRSNAT